MFYILFLILTVFADEKFVGEVFDLEGKTHLYTCEGSRVYNQDMVTFTSQYKNVQTGEVVATEKAEFKDGQLVRYDVARIPTKETGLIEVRDGKLRFTYTEDGKKSENKEDFKTDTLIGGSLAPYMEKHLDELLAKKALTFRYAVFFRKETVGFEFTFEKEENDHVVIKMNPTNFLYKSLVKPIYFTFDKKTKKLLSFKGRTLLRHKNGSSWNDLDGFTKYKYL